MASKRKKKKHGGADDELEEEALAEWLSRGLAMSDFTMPKMLRTCTVLVSVRLSHKRSCARVSAMLELWMEEDDGGEDDDDDAEDALAAKQELIQSYNVLGPVVEHAKELASEFKQTAIAEVRAWRATKSSVSRILVAHACADLM